MERIGGGGHGPPRWAADSRRLARSLPSWASSEFEEEITMSLPPLPPPIIEGTKALDWLEILRRIRYGLPGYATIAEAAETLGMPLTTVQAQIETAAGLGGQAAEYAREIITMTRARAAKGAGLRGLRAVLGLSTGALIALGIGVGVLLIGGYIYVNHGNTPINPGVRMSQPQASAVTAPGSSGVGPYYIYALNLSGGNIYIGSNADIQRPSCEFVDGGPPPCDGAPNVQVLETLGGPYDTYEQAVSAYCGMVTNTFPAWGGTKGYINGAIYWLDNVPSCAGVGPA